MRSTGYTLSGALEQGAAGFVVPSNELGSLVYPFGRAVLSFLVGYLIRTDVIMRRQEVQKPLLLLYCKDISISLLSTAGSTDWIGAWIAVTVIS